MFSGVCGQIFCARKKQTSGRKNITSTNQSPPTRSALCTALGAMASDDDDFGLDLPPPGPMVDFGEVSSQRRKKGKSGGRKKKPSLDPMLAAWIKAGNGESKADCGDKGAALTSLSKPGAVVDIVELNEPSTAAEPPSQRSGASGNSGARSEFTSGSASAADLLRVIQKDLNTLADDSKRKRRRALARIKADLGALFSRVPALYVEPGPGSDGKQSDGGGVVTTSGSKGAPSDGDEQLITGLFGGTAKPLLRRFGDSSESCRESAVTLVTEFARRAANLGQFLPFIIPVLRHRMSSKTPHPYFSKRIALSGATDDLADIREENEDDEKLFNWETPDPTETSEEVRLLNTKLLRIVVARCRKQLYPFLSDVVTLCVLALGDRYPDVRAECFACITELCEHFPAQVRGCAVDMAKIVMPSLRHRHARIRIAALRALRALVTCGGAAAIRTLTAFREHNVVVLKAFFHGETRVNFFASLCEDPNARVRREFFACMNYFMTELHERFNYETLIMPYVLAGLMDEEEDIQRAALATIERLGKEHEEWNKEKLEDQKYYGRLAERKSMTGRVEGMEALLPKPHKRRPTLGEREVVMRFAVRFLSPVTRELGDWRRGTKSRAAKLMQIILLYTEDFINDELQGVLAALTRHILEPELADDIAVALRLVGRFGDFGVITGEVRRALDRSCEDKHQERQLTALACVLEGAPARVATMHISPLLDVLLDPDVLAFRRAENLLAFGRIVAGISRVLDALPPAEAAALVRRGAPQRVEPRWLQKARRDGEQSGQEDAGVGASNTKSGPGGDSKAKEDAKTMADSPYYHFKSTPTEDAKKYRPQPLNAKASETMAKVAMLEGGGDGVGRSGNGGAGAKVEGALGGVHMVLAGALAFVTRHSRIARLVDEGDRETVLGQLDKGLASLVAHTPSAKAQPAKTGRCDRAKVLNGVYGPALLRAQTARCERLAAAWSADSYDMLLLEWLVELTPPKRVPQALRERLLKALDAGARVASDDAARAKMNKLSKALRKA